MSSRVAPFNGFGVLLFHHMHTEALTAIDSFFVSQMKPFIVTDTARQKIVLFSPFDQGCTTLAFQSLAANPVM
jgi:hypothetical protein